MGFRNSITMRNVNGSCFYRHSFYFAVSLKVDKLSGYTSVEHMT